MNCRKIYQAMSAYMDGELPGVDALVVRQHLASCSECRAEYEALRYTKQLLSRLRIQEPRPNLPQDIARRLEIENRRVTLSVDAIWEQFASRLRVVSPMARSLAFGAGLAVFGFGFVAMQADSADDAIQWNVASASTPLAPAPNSVSEGPTLNTVGYQSVETFETPSQMATPAAFTPLNAAPAASGGLSGPILVPGGHARTLFR